MAEATIEFNENGPYMVKGVAHCRNSRGEPITVQDTIYLCRCGASKNKPYCDGSHGNIGFKDEKTKSFSHRENREKINSNPRSSRIQNQRLMDRINRIYKMVLCRFLIDSC